MFFFQLFYVIIIHIEQRKAIMKNLFRILCGVSVMSMIPAVAGAVGTYYNGNLYQNPQQRYSRGGYYNSYGYGSGRNNYAQGAYGNQYNKQYGVERQLGTQKQQMQNKKQAQQTTVKQGLVLDAGISHEIGNWEFDMNNAGSKLHYDNLAWNVFDAKGVYYFGDNTKMQISAGFKYGKQYGDSPMIDDDISSDKAIKTVYYGDDEYAIPVTVNDAGGYDFFEGLFLEGNPAMSIGTSKDGSQLGYNFAFGLTDYFTWGKMKITPSVGYRYFKHKLTTQNNKGTAVGVFSATLDADGNPADVMVTCVTMSGSDEMQCVPYIISGDLDKKNGIIGFELEDGANTVYSPLYGGLVEVKEGFYYTLLAGGPFFDTPGTYYYEQPGTSHEYETEWYGPYLALDMEYQINQNNLFTGGIEFGLPIYDSKGNQPYRWDWAHPTSVEDKGDFGDAYHLGLNANWKTAITDSTYLSLGFTFDYYKVSDATATTYLNGSVYQKDLDDVNDIISNYDEYLDLGYKLASLADYVLLQSELNALRSAGWKIEDKKEINSIYKSMGIRVGISMRF